MARFALALAAVVLVISACGSGSDNNQLSVFAAASVTDALTELATSYEAANPDVEIVFNFAGSSTLRAQLLEGGPSDVVVLANEAIMDELAAEGVVETYEVMAANRMVIAVPVDNPGGVSALADLGNDSLLVGLCDQQVPCGETARTILETAGIPVVPDTNETDVRSLLAKVTSGELDAGIVYATDLTSAESSATGIEIDPSLYEPNLYPIAIVTNTTNPEDARRFIDFVLSAQGQAILADQGFLPPTQQGGQ